MLIIVENRNVKNLFQSGLNLETAGSGNVFQVDAAEGRSNVDHGLDDLFGILGVQADRHGVNASEFFEQNSFSLHDRHGSFGTDIAETQNSASVGNNSDGVLLHGVYISFFRIFGDLLAGLSNTRCVGQGQILAGLYGCFRLSAQFAFPFFMKLQCFFVDCHMSFLSVSENSVSVKILNRYLSVMNRPRQAATESAAEILYSLSASFSLSSTRE